MGKKRFETMAATLDKGSEARNLLEESMGKTLSKPQRPRKRYTAEEAKLILASGANTQGLGGVKKPRMNLSLTLETQEVVNVLSRIMGMNKCDFVNFCILKVKKDYAKEVKMCQEIIDSMND